MNAEEIIRRIESDPEYRGQIAHVRMLGARGSSYCEPSAPLHPALADMLKFQGIAHLYTHQAEALDRCRNGENLLLVTPTASGKTLCYNLPVAEELQADNAATALYIFPTKALGHDQKKRLQALVPGMSIETYDGDTPPAQRRRIRDEARVILTNPDMLHLSILPHNIAWSRFLGRLRYIVVDEVHVYRGVFGSHMAHVLRRLQRLCGNWGANPQWIMASATTGNPLEHAETLSGTKLSLIEGNGAPAGRRAFGFWDPDKGRQGEPGGGGYSSQAAWLFARLVRWGVRTILFARARQLTERLLVDLGAYLDEHDRARVKVYRGGYLPSDRRMIERQLFSGELVGVISTTALELGVDIGGLDAAVLLGFPGTKASFWQQSGRAGRAGDDSLTFYIPATDVLDHFLLSHPEYFFDRPFERAVIDPENPYTLFGHILCAAFEQPISVGDFARWGPMFHGMVDLLSDERSLNYGAGDGRWYYAGGGYPAESVSLRSAGEGTFVLSLEGDGKVIGTIDGSSAPAQVFPGAVYLQAGESYVVTRYDAGSQTVVLRPEAVDYFTEPAIRREVEIVHADRHREAGECRVKFGEIQVQTQVIGFRRRHASSGAILGQSPLDLPSAQHSTMGFWIELPRNLPERLLAQGMRADGAVHAAEHALVGLLPLFASTDRWDIGGTSSILHPSTACPAIFVFDGPPGGVGFSEQGYEAIESLIQKALETIRSCRCESGCPSCVQSPKCGHWNEPLDKLGAVAVLEWVLDGIRQG